MEKKTEKTLRQIKNLVDQDPLNPNLTDSGAGRR